MSVDENNVYIVCSKLLTARSTYFYHQALDILHQWRISYMLLFNISEKEIMLKAARDQMINLLVCSSSPKLRYETAKSIS